MECRWISITLVTITVLVSSSVAVGLSSPFYDTGESSYVAVEFAEPRYRRQASTLQDSVLNATDSRIGKDGHDMRTTASVDGVATEDEYEGAFTVDPSKPIKDLDGNEVNVTTTTEDTHTYYNSSFYSEATGAWKDYWVDLSNTNDSLVHDLLSSSHRRTATINITFEFPFYGHRITNVTLSTGGFLYMGDHLHPWLAATQYAAPLLADFDISSSLDSYVRYRDNGTALVVQWDNVMLHNNTELGPFTFQVTLFESGDIAFVYKDIPVDIRKINDDKHPVKVGLSDAYILDRTIFFVRRKIIYMYHKIEFKENYDISNNTMLLFKPLPTCMSLANCSSCVDGKALIGFECFWCPGVNRCSDGMDRKRQDWLIQGCDSNYIDTSDKCQAHEEDIKTTPPLTSSTRAPTTEAVTVATIEVAKKISTSSPSEPTPEKKIVAPSSEQHRADQPKEAEVAHMSGGSVFAIILVCGLLISGTVWIIFAYYNPHTPSGQFLIKYRPSAISLRRGEPQYTAAIHM